MTGWSSFTDQAVATRISQSLDCDNRKRPHSTAEVIALIAGIGTLCFEFRSGK